MEHGSPEASVCDCLVKEADCLYSVCKDEDFGRVAHSIATQLQGSDQVKAKSLSQVSNTGGEALWPVAVHRWGCSIAIAHLFEAKISPEDNACGVEHLTLNILSKDLKQVSDVISRVVRALHLHLFKDLTTK